MDSFKRPTFEPSTEVGIRSGLREDLYLVFAGAVNGTEEAVYRFNINPLVWWVWFGGFVLAFGGHRDDVAGRRADGRPVAAGAGGYGVSLVGAREGVSAGASTGTPAGVSRPATVLPRCGRAASPLRPPAVQDSLAGPRRDRHPARSGCGRARRGRRPIPRRTTPRSRRSSCKLACNCGCTLDVFTCRTTDFSCTYSPQLHREVLALRNRGMSASRSWTRSWPSTARRR